MFGPLLHKRRLILLKRSTRCRAGSMRLTTLATLRSQISPVNSPSKFSCLCAESLPFACTPSVHPLWDAGWVFCFPFGYGGDRTKGYQVYELWRSNVSRTSVGRFVFAEKAFGAKPKQILNLKNCFFKSVKTYIQLTKNANLVWRLHHYTTDSEYHFAARILSDSVSWCPVIWTNQSCELYALAKFYVCVVFSPYIRGFCSWYFAKLSLRHPLAE